MIVLKVTGMGCGSCVSKITKAIQSLDERARVEVDRASGTVSIDSDESAASLSDLVQTLGYGAEIGA
ncbi:heavy-metal-associated domain-containing protein [Pseudomonas sp. OTU5201]|uniref:heavy-metal-associated domain-containing protein n=1 Tax=Pseudomonas sp. OTU5201 TaxID=3043850 RepID=UPI00313BEAA5